MDDLLRATRRKAVRESTSTRTSSCSASGARSVEEQRLGLGEVDAGLWDTDQFNVVAITPVACCATRRRGSRAIPMKPTSLSSSCSRRPAVPIEHARAAHPRGGPEDGRAAGRHGAQLELEPMCSFIREADLSSVAHLTPRARRATVLAPAMRSSGGSARRRALTAASPGRSSCSRACRGSCTSTSSRGPRPTLATSSACNRGYSWAARAAMATRRAWAPTCRCCVRAPQEVLRSAHGRART